MRITVLGSNAGAPSRTNGGSGYLVESSAGAVMLDAGPGTFMRLAELMDPADLDGVVLSHLHVDHCIDAFSLFAYLAYEHQGAVRVPVVAPEGSRDHMASFVNAGPGHRFHDVFEFDEVAPGATTYLGGYEVAVGAAVHPVPALVTRIGAGGASLTYSGDTGPGGDLIELATGTGVLLCEASIQGVRDEDTYAYHLTAFEAGEVASASGAFELVLTHVSSRLDPQLSIDQASGAFVGPISYAGPGTTFSVRTLE